MTALPTSLIRNGAPKTYKRLMVICGVLAGLALGVGAALNRPFVAVGLYVLGMIVAVSVPYTTELTLFDERDDVIHRQASGFTLALFGWLSALVYPSLVVLSSTPRFSWGPATAAIAWTTVAVYTVYGLALGYYQLR